MSFPFAFPVDKTTADGALAKFNDFASNLKFREVFEEALRISFGPHYSIVLNISQRMNFFCKSCRKTLNCVTALLSHNVSGPHVKNVDMQIRSSMEESMVPLVSRFPQDSLQYAIACSQADILGAHLVEGYLPHHRRQRPATYFKCLLCGAHGKTEEILCHLKNDRHTDRYIKYNFRCNLSTFCSEVRESIRKQVAERDGITITDIRTIIDREGYLYPTRWEDEALSEKRLLHKYARCGVAKAREPRVSDLLPASRTLPHSNSRSSEHCSLRRQAREKTFKGESDPSGSVTSPSGMSNSFTVTQPEKLDSKFIESPLGVIIERDSGVSKNDQEVQVFTDWVTERCLRKLNFVVHTHSLKESSVKSPEDAQACLELMFSIGTLLQHTIKSLKDGRSHQLRLETIALLKKNVSKMQGYVKIVFADHWSAANLPIDCLAETLTLWNLK